MLLLLLKYLYLWLVVSFDVGPLTLVFRLFASPFMVSEFSQLYYSTARGTSVDRERNPLSPIPYHTCIFTWVIFAKGASIGLFDR